MAKVLRFNGVEVAGNWGGTAEFDFAPGDEVYVTFDARFTANYIAYLDANPFSSKILRISSQGEFTSVTVLYLNSTGGGMAEIFIDDPPGGFGTISPDTWYTIEYHVKQHTFPTQDDVDLWIDGVNVFSGTTYLGGDFVDTVILGLESVDNGDANQQFDIDNVSIGTTRGGSELMGPADFEDGSIVPPFTSIFDGSGDGESIFTFDDVPVPPIVIDRVGVFLDDVDVTAYCVEGSWTHRLNGVGTASVKLNMRAAGSVALFGATFPGPGSFLRIYTQTDDDPEPVLDHHGRVMNCETSADENSGYTVFNSSDPLELWAHRPVRDPPDTSGKYGDPGNFSKPSILEDFGNPDDDLGVNGAPRVVWAMLDGSENNTIPSDSEGPLRLFRGDYAAGVTGRSVVGAPSDWPMTMAEMASNLTATGICDIVITPIEMDVDGNIGQIDIYNGDYGTDRSDTVLFQYGMGAFNIRALRWNEDMTNLCNKVWYYLGPKCDDQHWRANITGDDPGLVFPPGGKLSPPASSTDNPLGVMIGDSRDAYDVRMDIRIFDGVGDSGDCVESGAVVAHDMWRWQWQNEAWLRAYPRTLIHITPTRNTAIHDFDVGDLVTVEASAEVKGGFTGVQRVYAYTVSWESPESVPAISELQTTSDQEGFLG